MTTKDTESRAWGVYRWLNTWRLGSARILKETPKQLVLEDIRPGGFSSLEITGYRSHVAPDSVGRTPQEAFEKALALERAALAVLEGKVDEQHRRIAEIETLRERFARGETSEVER